MDIFHVSAGAAGTVQTVARQAVRLDGRAPPLLELQGPKQALYRWFPRDFPSWLRFQVFTGLLLPNSYQGKAPLRLGFGALVI